MRELLNHVSPAYFARKSAIYVVKVQRIWKNAAPAHKYVYFGWFCIELCDRTIAFFWRDCLSVSLTWLWLNEAWTQDFWEIPVVSGTMALQFCGLHGGASMNQSCSAGSVAVGLQLDKLHLVGPW